MGDEPDNKILGTKATTAAAVNIATTLATAALAPHHPELALAVGGVSAAATSAISDRVGSMLAAARGIELGRLTRSFKALLFGGPKAQDQSAAAEQAQKVEERFRDPFFYTNARELTRGFLDAMEEEAIEPLANLARMYLLEGRRVDPFYRSTARLLVEADGALLGEVREMLRAVLGLMASKLAIVNDHASTNGEVELDIVDPGGQGFIVEAVRPNSAVTEEDGTQLGTIEAKRDVFAAFRTANIGVWNPGTYGGQNFRFRRTELERLAIVFGIDDDSAR